MFRRTLFRIAAAAALAIGLVIAAGAAYVCCGGL